MAAAFCFARMKITDRFPADQVSIVMDDSEAKAVLFELGKLDELSGEFPLATKVVCCVHKKHPILWFFGARYIHSDTPDGNGFAVIAWPKNLFTWPQVEKAIKAHLGNTLEGGVAAKPLSFKPRKMN